MWDSRFKISRESQKFTPPLIVFFFSNVGKKKVDRGIYIAIGKKYAWSSRKCAERFKFAGPKRDETFR